MHYVDVGKRFACAVSGELIVVREPDYGNGSGNGVPPTGIEPT